ncbi:MAG: hypothetical protein ACRD3W_25205 [Terriglobales bacterium]
MYKDKSVQGTTKFTGKRYAEQIAQADRDQKVLGGKKGTREIGAQIESMDGDPCENRLAGKSAPLPKGGAK